MAFNLLLLYCLLPRRRSGCPLLSWTSDNALVLPSSSPKPKSKHSMLPVLVFLFFVCWGLMSLLIVEQGRTIESQRTLIRSLFQDSSELSHLKGEASQKQHAEAQAQAEAKAHSQSQTPSTQDKSGTRKKAAIRISCTSRSRKNLPRILLPARTSAGTYVSSDFRARKSYESPGNRLCS